MKKSIRWGIAFILTLLVSTSMAMAEELPSETNVWQYKDWRVQFNEGVNPASVGGNIYVEDKSGYRVPQNISYEDDGKIVVITPESAYEMGQTYTISVLNGIKSFGGETLSEDVHKTFSTALNTPWSPYIIKVGKNTISLNWKYSDKYCTYHIYESDELDGEYTQVASEDGGYEWSYEWRGYEGEDTVKDGIYIKNLPYGQSKYYKVAAVKNGIESNLSSAVMIKMHSADEYVEFMKGSRLDGENYDLNTVFDQFFKLAGYEYSFSTYGFEPWASIGNDEVVFTGVPKNGSPNIEITFTITEYDNGSGKWSIKDGKLGYQTLSANEAGEVLRLIYKSYSPY